MFNRYEGKEEMRKAVTYPFIMKSKKKVKTISVLTFQLLGSFLLEIQFFFHYFEFC